MQRLKSFQINKSIKVLQRSMSVPKVASPQDGKITNSEEIIAVVDDPQVAQDPQCPNTSSRNKAQNPKVNGYTDTYSSRERQKDEPKRLKDQSIYARLKVYDQRTKTALGAQNPFHLRQAKKAQPALYDGEELLKNHHVSGGGGGKNVPSYLEELELAEATRNKLFSDMHDAFTIAQKRIADLESENFNMRNRIQNDDHDSMIKNISSQLKLKTL
ncbi:hypothetical protein Tco_0218545 [Tanacetum coccineum]